MTTVIQVTCRPLVGQDINTVQQMLMQAGWPSSVVPTWASLYSVSKYGAAFVATTGKTIVGFVRVISDRELVTYVAELVVAPAWRGQGVARALLDACAAQFPTARLDVLSSEQATGFYEQVGFNTKPGYRRWPA